MKMYQHVQFHDHCHYGSLVSCLQPDQEEEEELQYCIFANISHTIYNVFSFFFDKRFLLVYSLPECPQMWNEMHSESENCNFQMYRVDAE